MEPPLPEGLDCCVYLQQGRPAFYCNESSWTLFTNALCQLSNQETTSAKQPILSFEQEAVHFILLGGSSSWLTCESVLLR